MSSKIMAAGLSFPFSAKIRIIFEVEGLYAEILYMVLRKVSKFLSD